MINFYQLTFGLLKGHTCRYSPTCSEYTKEAIKIHGLKEGLLMGFKRFSTCHPWSRKQFFDPVPQKLEK